MKCSYLVDILSDYQEIGGYVLSKTMTVFVCTVPLKGNVALARDSMLEAR